MGRCIGDFELIEDGDKVMVCMSGGKDSYALMHLLSRAQKRAPIHFELIAVHLDQGHPGYDGTPLRSWLEAMHDTNGHAFHIERRDTYSVVKRNIPEGQTTCSLCSRLRRGVLYDLASKLGCTKIALGHHADDASETLLMNLMFNGALGAMPPKLISDDGRHTVIRPLLYCAEKDIAAFSEAEAFPILPCDLCGSQPNLWRQEVKALIGDLETRVPQIRQSMLKALTNVRRSHLLDVSLLRDSGVPVGIASLDDEAEDAAREALGPAPRQRASSVSSRSTDIANVTRRLPLV